MMCGYDPVDLPVEGELLDNRKEREQESIAGAKKAKGRPLLPPLEDLRHKKDEPTVTGIEQPLRPCCIPVGRLMQEELNQHHPRKQSHGDVQRIKKDVKAAIRYLSCSPNDNQASNGGFQNAHTPGLNGAKSQWPESKDGANSGCQDKIKDLTHLADGRSTGGSPGRAMMDSQLGQNLLLESKLLLRSKAGMRSAIRASPAYGIQPRTSKRIR
ncbi:hypothetical protein [Granulicella mallensis]|uniref:hypothetical protein n=1 Tax=Granulicella mallensis TaxID=940614 RepID=UPI00167FD52F|nr:hypothetical protein [Granulicella mallensis]